MPTIRSPHLFPAQKQMAIFTRLCPDLPTQQGDINPLPLPGALPVEEGGEDARHQVLCAAVVGDHRAHGRYGATINSRGGNKAPHGLASEIRAFHSCIWA